MDIAWGVHGRKPARTTTIVGRDDPLDSIPSHLHGLCARRQSPFGSASVRWGSVRAPQWIAVLRVFRDIYRFADWIDNVCGVVWVSLGFSRRVCCGKWLNGVVGRRPRS